jgi:hypothetical protein
MTFGLTERAAGIHGDARHRGRRNSSLVPGVVVKLVLAVATMLLTAGWSIEREHDISAAEIARMERAR